MSATNDWLGRLLVLVPYFIARPGIAIADAAADFGVTERQLRRDLELLWLCGLPGYGPGDLIDLSFSGDTVTVTFDAGMRRPLRLTAAEATALLVALRALADTTGVADVDAVRRALAKIEAAVGKAQPSGVVVDLALTEGARIAEVRDTVRDALRRGRALRIRYYTVSRDEISERVVDPMRLLLVDGRSYLEAWCRRAEGVRLFRLDRMDAVHVLGEPSTPPPYAEQTDVSAGLFRPAPEQRTAWVVLAPDACWVAEYYPVDELTEFDDGRVRVRMRYTDESWMCRLMLGLGGDAIVEQPVELVELIRDQAYGALHLTDHLPVT
ncbi:MAG: helix-turn-helix transcriptional regulator [Sciscionella sp.]